MTHQIDDPTIEALRERFRRDLSLASTPDALKDLKDAFLGRKSGAKDLTNKENQAKLTDEDAFKGIKLGRKNNKGEEKMEPFGDRLSDKEISDLVAYSRSFAR